MSEQVCHQQIKWHEGPPSKHSSCAAHGQLTQVPAASSSLSYRPHISVLPPGPDGELSDALWCECQGCRHLTLASFQPGPGQSGGCHGFDSAHDPAYITHPASRDCADPLHNGLAFFNVRASISHTPPCPVQWRGKKKAQNCPLSAQLRPLYRDGEAQGNAGRVTFLFFQIRLTRGSVFFGQRHEENV